MKRLGLALIHACLSLAMTARVIDLLVNNQYERRAPHGVDCVFKYPHLSLCPRSAIGDNTPSNQADVDRA